MADRQDPPGKTELFGGMLRKAAEALRSYGIKQEDREKAAGISDTESPAEDATEAGGKGFFTAPVPSNDAQKQRLLKNRSQN